MASTSVRMSLMRNAMRQAIGSAGLRSLLLGSVLGASVGTVVGCQSDRAPSVQGASVQGARPAASHEASSEVSTTAKGAPASPKSPVEGAVAPITSVSSAKTKASPDEAKRLPPLASTQKGFAVFAPGDCFAGDDAAYDLVVHFHGLADVVQAQREKAGVGDVLAVVNAGAWSRDYRREYGSPGTLDTVLSRVSGEVEKLCPGKKHAPGRLALSGWSAGYSVIRHILGDSGPERVDAVLLSDGIHAGLAPSDGDPRGVLPVDVASFVTFGKLATEGKKLMSITHSSIRTPDYASTTETTDYLLSQLGLTRQKTTLSAIDGPSRDASKPTSEVDKAGFHLRGYEGPTAPDHIWQIRSMGETLFVDLKTWWAR